MPWLHFKIAAEPSEFEQIHRLNYQTFVEEIPQHSADPERRLVDRLHDQNTYVICLEDTLVVGMVSVCGARPFSLDRKLADLDAYLPAARHICEIRLLAVVPAHRKTGVFAGLMRKLAEHCEERGYDLAVISGTVRQRKLYRHLGFVPFGPLVGTPEAPFQPMYLRLDTYREQTQNLLYRTAARTRREQPASFLPGPVQIGPGVRRALAGIPVSHRDETFVADFLAVKERLCHLVNAGAAAILLGSGTLANDAVAAQLSLLPGPGLILANGEFGERLVDHAQRFGLDFRTVCSPWGQRIPREALAKHSGLPPAWLWAVHCETSTGVLNDVAYLKQYCAQRQIKLCLDCISAIGTVPVDLTGVHLATGVSGKGLGAPSGLSMVFHHHSVLPSRRLPRYLDLGLYAESDGIPFTHSSNLIYALRAALQRFETGDPIAAIATGGATLRSDLRRRGFQVVGDDAHCTPAVATVALPAHIRSGQAGARLQGMGFQVSYASAYLLERNWIQICLMVEIPPPRIRQLLDALEATCATPTE